jgi:hypothetical protein
MIKFYSFARKELLRREKDEEVLAGLGCVYSA